ncbi:MAG: cell division protein FtsW [candidate division Zixibacteria bacterium]|nr:cell division protein FtsW [candidate division Zixibacteria bacterium]
MRSRTAMFDNRFAILVLVLSLFGILMVYSSSAHFAEQYIGDSLFYFKRQLLWLVISLIGGSCAYLFGYRRLIELSPIILAVSIILLVAVLFLPEVRNVHRWIKIGSINFQPSEMARIALILFFAMILPKQIKALENFKTYMILVGGALLVGGLIMIEPDIGTTLSLIVSLGLILFLAGSRKTHLAVTIAVAVVGISVLIFGLGYERSRIDEYFLGLENPYDSQYQVLQGLLAIGSGGIFGTGLGIGGQKLLFLPEPHSDFIFASIAEETGILITLPLITVFLLLFLRGCKIASKCQDKSGMLAAFGLSALVATSAFINIGVVLGVLPVTGLPLPFVSYGGSSLLFNMIAVGIILSVSKANSNALLMEKTGFGGYNFRRRRNWRSHIPGVSYRKPAYKRSPKR